MAGASLMPEFYNSKLNVCVFFAPPASLHKNPSKILETLAYPTILKSIKATLEMTGIYDVLTFDPKHDRSICNLFNGAIC